MNAVIKDLVRVPFPKQLFSPIPGLYNITPTSFPVTLYLSCDEHEHDEQLYLQLVLVFLLFVLYVVERFNTVSLPATPI